MNALTILQQSLLGSQDDSIIWELANCLLALTEACANFLFLFLFFFWTTQIVHSSCSQHQMMKEKQTQKQTRVEEPRNSFFLVSEFNLQYRCTIS